MNLIDADKFLSYLIFSKHIDSLTCGEVKEAVEMCNVDVLDKVRAEIKEHADRLKDSLYGDGLRHAIEIIDKYRAESEDKECLE